MGDKHQVIADEKSSGAAAHHRRWMVSPDARSFPIRTLVFE
jgi:hypothetical protein